MSASGFWHHRNTFVTGCTGLLGSWLVQALLERGATVTGLIRDRTPGSHLVSSGSVHKINIVRGEVENYLLLERTLNEYEIDTVFHLAAQTIVGIANNNALSTFETNIRGTWSVLEAARRNKQVKRILIASSDKAYGEHEVLPYMEDAPLQGAHPYDVSKSCADLLGQAYFKTYGLPVCITRCGNLYGGGDLNFNRIIPGTIRSVVFGQRPVIRSDGMYTRDYFFVRDATEAYLLLAERMEELKLSGEAFNFSTETPTTVLALTEQIIELMSATHLQPIVLNEAKGEIKNQFLSATKAKQLLGWHPLYTLEEGLRETIRWYRQHFNGQYILRDA